MLVADFGKGAEAEGATRGKVEMSGKPGPKPKYVTGLVRCPECRVVKPLTDYRVRRWDGAMAVLWNPRCRECVRKWDRARAKTDPVRARHRVEQISRYRRNQVQGRERNRSSYRRMRHELTAGYVRHLLCWKAPDWVVNLKRAQLVLKRSLKATK